MRDHPRILGTLFWAWAALQIVGALVATIWAHTRTELVMTGSPMAFWLVTVFAVAAYAWTGQRLRRHDPRIRVPALILCVLALLSFPFGTALGAYGLWALIKHRETLSSAS
jgi:threonine/homoserine efflux transporter RhtA